MMIRKASGSVKEQEHLVQMIHCVNQAEIPNLSTTELTFTTRVSTEKTLSQTPDDHLTSSYSSRPSSTDSAC